MVVRGLCSVVVLCFSMALVAQGPPNEPTVPKLDGGAAQVRFPLLRASHAHSDNRRNHAVYDLRIDWLLAGTASRSHDRVDQLGARIDPCPPRERKIASTARVGMPRCAIGDSSFGSSRANRASCSASTRSLLLSLA